MGARCSTARPLPSHAIGRHSSDRNSTTSTLTDDHHQNGLGAAVSGDSRTVEWSQRAHALANQLLRSKDGEYTENSDPFLEFCSLLQSPFVDINASCQDKKQQNLLLKAVRITQRFSFARNPVAIIFKRHCVKAQEFVKTDHHSAHTLQTAPSANSTTNARHTRAQSSIMVAVSLKHVQAVELGSFRDLKRLAAIRSVDLSSGAVTTAMTSSASEERAHSAPGSLHNKQTTSVTSTITTSIVDTLSNESSKPPSSTSGTSLLSDSGVHLASEEGAEAIDVNYSDLNGQTALIIACSDLFFEPSRCVSVVQQLLSQPHIDVNMQAAVKDGGTALHQLIYTIQKRGGGAQYELQVAKLLLEHPTLDINLADDSGCTVLHLICLKLEWLPMALIDAVLKHPNIRESVNMCDTHGNTPLMAVLKHDYIGGDDSEQDSRVLRIVRELITLGADVNLSCGSPLLLCLSLRSPQPASVIHSLIEAGADLNFQGERGFTPMHCALINGRADGLAELVRAIPMGVDLEVCDESGHSVLDWSLNIDFTRFSGAKQTAMMTELLNIPRAQLAVMQEQKRALEVVLQSPHSGSSARNSASYSDCPQLVVEYLHDTTEFHSTDVEPQ